MNAAAVGATRAAQGLAAHRTRCPHRADRRVSVLFGSAGDGGTIGEPAADRRVEVDALRRVAALGHPTGPIRIAQRGPAAEQQPVRGITQGYVAVIGVAGCS